jgi:alanine racemase
MPEQARMSTPRAMAGAAPNDAKGTAISDAATGRISIDLAQLARNWQSLATLVAPARCGAVVKANAYGLGAHRIIPALAQAGCTTFFIATPAEGHQARSLLPQSDIFALDGLLPGSAEAFADDAIMPVLSTLADVESWAALARKRATRLACALHIDSGLNRLGLTSRDTRRLAANAALLNALDIRFVMSHLACADNPADPKNRDQLLAFETLSALFPGIPRSLAASDGLMLGKAYHFDLTRPGYALYGGQASATHRAPVSSVVTVTARILAINDVPPGETVGYAASWRAARPSRIAIVAAGYADGVSRSASWHDGKPRGHVVIAGHKVPIVGRVSMDLITADVTDIPARQLLPGDDAMLYGPGLSIEDAGFDAGTIGYEVLTRLGQRFERVYLT